MERAIEDRECADEIAGLRESGSLSMQDQQAEFGIAASTTPVRTFNLKNYIALLERRRALKATRARVATEHAGATVDRQQAYTAWRDESPGDDANEETPRQGRSSDFLDQAYAGAGYGAKISQVEARRGTTANSVSEWDSILNMSGGARRQVRREARMASSATEPKYMAFEAFEDASSARSMVVSQEMYSAVDTGTTVTIAKADGTQLESFDPQSALRIMGFNGSTTRSQGTGVLVGFAKDRQGRQIELRVPHAHLIKGAPSDLLSVSSLVALGYSFHFTPQVSYIVTPQGDIVDLIVKKGLYWLKWDRPIDPSAARRPVKAGGAAAAEDEIQGISGNDIDEAADELNAVNGAQDDPIPAVSTPCCSFVCPTCNVATRVKEQAVPLKLLHERFGHFNTAT
jgi:hypothetical protein